MSLDRTIVHGPSSNSLARPPVNALDPALCTALRNALAEAARRRRARHRAGRRPEGVFRRAWTCPTCCRWATTAPRCWPRGTRSSTPRARWPMPGAGGRRDRRPRARRRLRAGAVLRLPGDGATGPVPHRPQRNPGGPGGARRHPAPAAPRGRPASRGTLLVGGELVDAERALASAWSTNSPTIDEVATRARVWLEALLALPREPMLQTRAIARADVVAALQPERIQLERFIDAWTRPDTQAGLRALMARLGK